MLGHALDKLQREFPEIPVRAEVRAHVLDICEGLGAPGIVRPAVGGTQPSALWPRAFDTSGINPSVVRHIHLYAVGHLLHVRFADGPLGQLASVFEAGDEDGDQQGDDRHHNEQLD